MDAFKILTRSTKLSRPSTKSARLQVTPSAGEASNPQLFGDASTHKLDSSDLNLDSSIKGKKRKRGHNDPAKETDIPTELNFFSDVSAAKETTKSRDIASSINVAGAREIQDATLNRDLNEATADVELPEGECKRILGSHKIKITQLWAPPASTDDRQQSAKKKKRKQMSDELSENAVGKSKKQKMDIVPQPLTSFGQLRSRYNLPQKLARNIEEQGYSVPTEVQLGSLPLLLGSYANTHMKAGSKHCPASSTHGVGAPGHDLDLLTVAPTGSGKTLAFLIPVLCAILKERSSHIPASSRPSTSNDLSGPKAVIIVPTKELASQIVNEGRKLTKQTGLKVTMVRKGMRFSESHDATHGTDPNGKKQDKESSSANESNDEDERETATPVVRSDVLVSTPLTLLHAITEGKENVHPLSTVRYLVLDEADVLLDALFREQTLQIWSACTNALLRVSLWSATMGSSIEDLAKATIEKRWNNMSKLQPGNIERPPLIRLIVGLKDSAIPNIHHKLVYAGTESGKLMALRQLLHPSAASPNDGPALQPPFLVFTQTIPRAIALHSEMLYDIPQEAGGATRIAVLHADLSDSARERVMTRFRKGEIWVLITTDLLSRGVDFRGVNGVVNYDFPNSSAAYVHRVGRTGRAGREGGVAVTLYAKEDIPFVKNVANVIAASERHKGTKGDGKGIQQWLLDAMPKPTKKEKQQLKKRGIESRRAGYVPKGKGETVAKTRISTKSGFDRKLENNRKATMHRTKSRVEPNPIRVSADDEDFSGFED